MQTMMIFGKTGQVATALKQMLESYDIKPIVIGSDDLDLSTLTDSTVITNLIKEHTPVALLNAAAYTAVDQAESEPEKAMAINAIAPGHMATACKIANIPLIHVSTDFVFGGNTATPYKEEDQTNPLNVYGQTKLAGEQAITQSNCIHVILRTSWVFSETGKNFVTTMLNLGKDRDTLNIVSDQYGTPTPALAIAHIMVLTAQKIINHPYNSGIYHFCGDEPTNWSNFARAIFDEAEMDINVNDITTSEYPTPAQRPDWSVLNTEKIHKIFGIPNPSWRTALRETIIRLQ